MSDEVWAETLVAWYRALPTVDVVDIPKHVKELFPFFILRTVSFWNEVADISANEVERVVQTQAAIFADRFAIATDSRR